MADVFKGYALPIRKRSRGFFSAFTGMNTLKTSMMMIIGTRLGERVHMPDFGSRIHELVFEPNDSVLENLGRLYVEESIGRWEPRITLIEIDVLRDVDNQELLVKITFSSKQPIVTEELLTVRFTPEGRLIGA